MKAQRVTTSLIDGMAFEVGIDGHKIIIDADERVGGKNLGPRPKAFMQAALGGCTGMDVISILRKMRVEVEGFKVHVEGEFTEEHPKHYSSMHLIYEFTGKDLNIEKLKKAINLSQERYCGVSASYIKAMKITHEIIVNEQ